MPLRRRPRHDEEVSFGAAQDAFALKAEGDRDLPLAFVPVKGQQPESARGETPDPEIEDRSDELATQTLAP